VKECTQCGKCCLLYSDGGLSASAEEIEAWETFNPAIAEYVVDGKIWMDPKTGEQLTRCPWLELLPAHSSGSPDTYGCGIYQDRPEDCRHYPTSIAEMVRDGCEMIEVRDLNAPAQAQKTLDAMMSDSRPPAQQTRPYSVDGPVRHG
jgi:Fe-S-cluster containining protein